MTGSRLFWMAVQALFVALLTLPAILEPHSPDKPRGILVSFGIAVAVVGFMTAVIVNWKDAAVRWWRGIPQPPKANAGEPLYQPAPSKSMTAGRWVSLLAHVAAIAAIAAWIEYVAPGEPRFTISVPIAFVLVLIGASLFHRVKEFMMRRRAAGVELLPPDRT